MWHHYLYGSKFTVYSDHNCLKLLKSIKKPNSRLFNWLLKLSQYDFEIEYMRGNANLETDALSRNLIDETHEREEHLKIINLFTKNELNHKLNYFLLKIYYLNIVNMNMI